MLAGLPPDCRPFTRRNTVSGPRSIPKRFNSRAPGNPPSAYPKTPTTSHRWAVSLAQGPKPGPALGEDFPRALGVAATKAPGAAQVNLPALPRQVQHPAFVFAMVGHPGAESTPGIADSPWRATRITMPAAVSSTRSSTAPAWAAKLSRSQQVEPCPHHTNPVNFLCTESA